MTEIYLNSAVNWKCPKKKKIKCPDYMILHVGQNNVLLDMTGLAEMTISGPLY